MQKQLDYSAVWADAVALLKAHREAVVAISGFFLFAVTWAFSFLVPEPELRGVQTVTDIAAVLSGYFRTNWPTIIPVTLIGSYGGFVIYVLLNGQNLTKVGDALTMALTHFLPYFIASLLSGWLTLLGFVAFMIPGLYLVARFVVLPALMAAEPGLGVMDSIRATWATTSGVGWSTFLLLFAVALVTWLISVVGNLIVGLICVVVGGPGGIPLLQTGVAALFTTMQALIFIALIVAIYRHLRPQAAIR